MHKKYAVLFRFSSKIQSVKLPIMHKSSFDKIGLFFSAEKLYIPLSPSKGYVNWIAGMTSLSKHALYLPKYDKNCKKRFFTL